MHDSCSEQVLVHTRQHLPVVCRISAYSSCTSIYGYVVTQESSLPARSLVIENSLSRINLLIEIL